MGSGRSAVGSDEVTTVTCGDVSTAYRLLFRRMIPHTIRLRRPWEEVEGAVEGRKVFRRRFNRPTGLDAWERVTLEIDRVLFCGQVFLNGTLLGEFRPGEVFAAEITTALLSANELVAEVDPRTAVAGPVESASIYIVDPAEEPGSPIGDVRLVIRADSRRGGD